MIWGNYTHTASRFSFTCSNRLLRLDQQLKSHSTYLVNLLSKDQSYKNSYWYNLMQLTLRKVLICKVRHICNSWTIKVFPRSLVSGFSPCAKCTCKFLISLLCENFFCVSTHCASFTVQFEFLYISLLHLLRHMAQDVRSINICVSMS